MRARRFFPRALRLQAIPPVKAHLASRSQRTDVNPMTHARNRIKAGILGVAMLFGGAINGLAQGSPELTLTQAVSLATANSRDLALARVRYTIAKDQARVSKTPFLPNLDAGSALARSSGYPVSINAQPPSVFQVNYSEAILDEALRNQFRAQEERAKSLEIEVGRTRDDVIVRTVTSYLELAKARHSLDLLHGESASAQRIVEYTRERVAAGMDYSIEVTRSELTLAKIEQEAVQLGGRIEILTDQLHKLTGLPPERLETISTERLPEIDQSTADHVQDAVEISPILRAMGFERSARQATLQGARRGYWPSVDLVGQYNLFAKFNNYQQFFATFQRNSVAIGVLIRIPVFSPKTSANVALARSQLSEVDLTLANLRDNQEIATKQSTINAADLYAKLRVARLELTLSQEYLALVQSRFDQGQSTLKELEQARLDEGERSLALLDSDFAFQQGELALMQMTGRLSQVFK
jgi:outer membrane protein